MPNGPPPPEGDEDRERSIDEEPPALIVLSPEEALRRARPLPSDSEMAIEGLTEDEWKAFEQALTER